MKLSAIVILLLLAVPVRAQAAHTVKLTITDTVNPTGTRYNIYRANAACSTSPTLTLLTATPISTLTYTDASVTAGSYCYAATAVGPLGDESAKSPTAIASIPTPPNAITITVTVQ